MKKKTNAEVAIKIVDKQFNLLIKDIKKAADINNNILMRMTECCSALNEAIKLDKED